MASMYNDHDTNSYINFIKMEISKSPNPNEKGYAIAGDWWKRWKDHVNFDNNNGNAFSSNPDRIDNSNLGKGYGDQIVSKKVWKKLYIEFGVLQENSTPQIVLAAYNSEKTATFTLYPVTVKFTYENKEKDISFIEDLKKDMILLIVKENLEIEHDVSITFYSGTTIIDFKIAKDLSDYKCLNVVNTNEYDNDNHYCQSDEQDFPTNNFDAMVPQNAKSDSDVSMHSFNGNDRDRSPFRPNSTSWLNRSTEYDPNRSNSEMNYPGGLRGLRNIGSTCYMNSALQCLLNVPQMTEFFLEPRDLSSLIREQEENPCGAKGKIVEYYAELVKEMWTPSSMDPYEPDNLKFAVSIIAPQFEGSGQQDMQQFLTVLLDGLHEEMNKNFKNSRIPFNDNEKKSSKKELALAAMKRHKNRNESFIVDNFHGWLKSALECYKCRTRSHNFEPFASLSVPMPNLELQEVSVLLMDRKQLVRVTVSVPKTVSVKQLSDKICEMYETSSPLIKLGFGILKEGRIQTLEDSDCIPMLNAEDVYGSRSHCQTFPTSWIVACPLTNELLNVLVTVYFKIEGDAVFGHPFLIGVHKDLDSDSLLDVLRELAEACNLDQFYEVNLYINNKKEEQLCVDSIMEAGPEASKIDLIFENEKEKQYPFLDMNHIPNRDYCDRKDSLKLKDCFDIFKTVEILTDENNCFCKICNEKTNHYKKFDLWTLPNVLLVQLKRFSFDPNNRRKITTPVQIPFRDFKVIETSTMIDHSYNLCSFGSHVGDLGGGHYFAHAKNSQTEEWHKFDDTFVTGVEESQIDTDNATILVFVKDSPIESN